MVVSATVFQMTVQRALHDSQTFWLVFVTVLFSNFSEITAKTTDAMLCTDWIVSISKFLAQDNDFPAF